MVYYLAAIHRSAQSVIELEYEINIVQFDIILKLSLWHPSVTSRTKSTTRGGVRIPDWKPPE